MSSSPQSAKTDIMHLVWQVYGAEKSSKIVLWVSIELACLFGLLALILLTAPLWSKNQTENDPEAAAAQTDQQEPLLGSSATNDATNDASAE